MKIAYVRDAAGNPFGCIVEENGLYGYSVCRPGETFRKDKGREIAIGRVRCDRATSRRKKSKAYILQQLPEDIRYDVNAVFERMEEWEIARGNISMVQDNGFGPDTTTKSPVVVQPQPKKTFLQRLFG